MQLRGSRGGDELRTSPDLVSSGRYWSFAPTSRTTAVSVFLPGSRSPPQLGMRKLEGADARLTVARRTAVALGKALVLFAGGGR